MRLDRWDLLIFGIPLCYILLWFWTLIFVVLPWMFLPANGPLQLIVFQVIGVLVFFGIGLPAVAVAVIFLTAILAG